MTNPVRLALFITDLTGGGAERVMINLASSLAEQGFAVDLVLARARGELLSQVPETVRVVDLAARHVMLSLPALLRYLQRERPIALLSALNQPNVVAIWAKKFARSATKVVISVHNTLSVEAKQGGNARLKIMPVFVKRFYPNADAIVCVSQGSADDLAQMTGLSPDRIQVIYNPVVSDEMLAKARQPVDHPWFAPGQTPVVLSVGRLSPQKNYTLLLQAFALARKQKEMRLLILGEGEERGALEALAHSLGISEDVQMPGFVQNPYAYMNQAALLALSSRWEGLPTVLIEALACGTPVIATDCPSGPREILRDGQYGALVPMNDPEAFARAIVLSLSTAKQSPPAESWQPYLHRVAAQKYCQILMSAGPVS